MNTVISLKPTDTLAFANAISDPEEKQKLLEHLAQRPWSKENRIQAVLNTLNIEVYNQKPDVKASKAYKRLTAKQENAPHIKRYYRHPPLKKYTLDEVFAFAEKENESLLPFKALDASVGKQSTEASPSAESSSGNRNVVAGAYARPTKKLSERSVSIPSPQSPIAKNKRAPRGPKA